MKLLEFFNKPLDVNKDVKSKSPNLDNLNDDLFWFIIDHDKLHKDYFFSIAKKIKTLKECEPEMILELYMPMVKKGCKEYYQKEKLQGKLSKIFPVKFREEMCHRIHDHYYDDIGAGKYKLG
jgi:hypothetical protein